MDTPSAHASSAHAGTAPLLPTTRQSVMTRLAPLAPAMRGMVSAGAVLVLTVLATLAGTGGQPATTADPPATTAGQPATPPAAYAEILAVDDATGRGVPLVELETVHHVRFVTDNAGRAAIGEPDLLGREVFLYVRSHGYEVPADGFGFRGIRATLRPGERVTVRLRRLNVAERLCRLTGEGLYRDTVLLGGRPPLPPPNGQVAGQDSVQAAVYRGQIYWFWGDTNRLRYPLGLFRTAGARTPRFGPDFDPAAGIPFEYFVGKDGFVRPMIPLPDQPQGVVWIDGVCVVPDTQGRERLVCHYSRRKGLTEELAHGIAAFDEAAEQFVPVRELPLEEKWRHPQGHAVRQEENGQAYILFGNPAPLVRVPARYEALLDPQQYEAWTCAAPPEKPASSAAEPRNSKQPLPAVQRDARGQPAWRWQRDLPPLSPQQELELLKAGKLQPGEVRFCPADAARPDLRVLPHSGTVRWNPYRQRWIMVFGQLGGSSLLGEVWYAEATHPTGPFRRAVKIVTHDRYSFYNVCHHPFLDRDNGRIINFEGTYTAEFSGNPVRTPRYDYNQVLYRLDLDAAALRAARSE